MTLKRLLVKARCSALDELSSLGPFLLKMAALADLSGILRRRSSLQRLPRVFHWTQTTQRKRLRVQASSDMNLAGFVPFSHAHDGLRIGDAANVAVKE